MSVNTDLEQLQAFAKFLSRFSEDILRECHVLGVASDRYTHMVTNVLGTERDFSARDMTRKVENILREAEPSPEDLRKQVEQYVKLMKGFRSLTGD